VGGVGAFRERVRQVAIGVVELDDLLLDRVGRDQAVDRDRTGLADAVGAVRGLLLDRGAPPRGRTGPAPLKQGEAKEIAVS